MIASAAGRRGHLVDAGLAAAGLAYSSVILVFSLEYSFAARVFAQVAGAAGLLTSIAYLILSARSYAAAPPDAPPTPEERAESARTRLRLLSALAIVLAGIAVVYLLGVYIFSFTFALAFLRLFAGHSWRTALLISVGVTVFNFLMFDLLFGLSFHNVGVLLK